MPYTRYVRDRPLDGVGRSIWRYMDRTKFTDMVDGHPLFFTRLRYFVASDMDVHEGELAPSNYLSDVNPADMVERVLGCNAAPHIVRMVERQYGPADWLHRQEEWVREHAYVNCWCVGEFESQTMWDQYVQDNEGLVVRSTIRRLVRAFTATPGALYIQPVHYYDPESEATVPPDPFLLPTYKHKRWRHECELRCFVILSETSDAYRMHPNGLGLWLSADLAALIEEVRVPLRAGRDFINQIEELLVSTGLATVPVTLSALERG